MRGAGTNTRVTYRYWRGDGWDRQASVVVSGRLSRSQRGQVLMALAPPNRFLPTQLGWGDLLPPSVRTDDVPWHELVEIADTRARPTVDANGDDLVRAFATARWDARSAGAQLGIPEDHNSPATVAEDFVMFEVFFDDL